MFCPEHNTWDTTMLILGRQTRFDTCPSRGIFFFSFRNIYKKIINTLFESLRNICIRCEWNNHDYNRFRAYVHKTLRDS